MDKPLCAASTLNAIGEFTSRSYRPQRAFKEQSMDQKAGGEGAEFPLRLLQAKTRIAELRIELAAASAPAPWAGLQLPVMRPATPADSAEGEAAGGGDANTRQVSLQALLRGLVESGGLTAGECEGLL